MWQPKTLRGAFLPITTLNWLCGLSLFEYPLGKPRFVLSVLYILLTTSAYCYALSYVPTRGLSDKNKIRKAMFQIFQYSNFFISTCCILFNWYNYKEYKILIQRLEILNGALESLGLPNKYGQVFRDLLLKIGMWIIIVFVSISSDIFVFLEIFDLVKTLHTSYVFQYSVQLTSVVDLTFTSIVHSIGLKFDSINFLLKRILLLGPKPIIVDELYRKHSPINPLVTSTKQSNILNDGEHQNKALMILIRYFHMDLTNISFQVNEIYRNQMTMLIGSCLITITSFFYAFLTYIIFFDPNSNEYSSSTRPIIGAAVWCAVYTYRFLKVNFICAKVSFKSRNTRDILYEIKNAIQNEELKQEIEQFTLQLTQRPLIFTVCGFSTSDYTFFRGFIKKVGTCLIILLQNTDKNK